MTGLHAAAQSRAAPPIRSSASFPFPVAGKTGTAQRPGQPDQSWYIVLAPVPNPQIVVAVTVERGGFGVDSGGAGRRARSSRTTSTADHADRTRSAHGLQQAAQPDYLM